MPADEVARVHRLIVSARLGNLLTVHIHHESVSDTRLVRRAIVQRDARHERRLKPAAVLIGRFHVHVGRVMQLRASRADCLVRNAAVYPDIDRVVAMLRPFR